MIYFIAYGTIGILIVAIQKWIFNRHPTAEESLIQIVESMQHLNGMSFSDRLARFIAESIALVIAIVVWPVIAFNLLRRFKKSTDANSKE